MKLFTIDCGQKFGDTRTSHRAVLRRGTIFPVEIDGLDLVHRLGGEQSLWIAPSLPLRGDAGWLCQPLATQTGLLWVEKASFLGSHSDLLNSDAVLVPEDLVLDTEFLKQLDEEDESGEDWAIVAVDFQRYQDYKDFDAIDGDGLLSSDDQLMVGEVHLENGRHRYYWLVRKDCDLFTGRIPYGAGEQGTILTIAVRYTFDGTGLKFLQVEQFASGPQALDDAGDPSNSAGGSRETIEVRYTLVGYTLAF